MAWRPDPFSQATDAMQQVWPEGLLYAFPPFSLISRVLHKVRRDRFLHMIIITPAWHSQPWYPQLLEMSIQNPILLPKRKDLLRNPSGKTHPLTTNNSLRLVTWKVSGRDYRTHEYQNQLQSLSQDVEESLQWGVLNRPGESGLAGVLRKKLIPFHVM